MTGKWGVLTQAEAAGPEDRGERRLLALLSIVASGAGRGLVCGVKAQVRRLRHKVYPPALPLPFTEDSGAVRACGQLEVV